MTSKELKTALNELIFESLFFTESGGTDETLDHVMHDDMIRKVVQLAQKHPEKVTIYLGDDEKDDDEMWSLEPKKDMSVDDVRTTFIVRSGKDEWTFRTMTKEERRFHETRRLEPCDQQT